MKEEKLSLVDQAIRECLDLIDVIKKQKAFNKVLQGENKNGNNPDKKK